MHDKSDSHICHSQSVDNYMKDGNSTVFFLKNNDNISSL